MSEFVKIVEVGPRDGLQNEKQALTVEQRLNFINDLINAGLKSIEVGSCVSAKWVPQMAQSDELFKLLPQTADVQFSLLTPISKVLKLLKRSDAKRLPCLPQLRKALPAKISTVQSKKALRNLAMS